MELNSRLVVALDVPDKESALLLADKLAGLPVWMKVGLELFTAAGPEIVFELRERGFQVFLDLKFHDIPNTVYGAVKSAARLGARLISIHLSGGAEMVKAAADAKRDVVREFLRERKSFAPPLLLGVTMLTSTTYGQSQDEVLETVVYAARLAKAWNIEGVVCSGLEAAAVKDACESNFICLCPGIRFADGEADDQARVVTPGEAVLAGADFLVMGRPITRAENPAEAVQRALAEMEAAEKSMRQR